MSAKLVMLLVVALLLVPLAVSYATYTPADVPWYATSRAATGLAPDPATVREPVIQVYAARAFAWRGAFGVHTWIIVKREGDAAFTRYDVTGWSGASTIRVNAAAPDALWYGNRPQLLLDLRGADAAPLIDRIESAIRSYPYADTYRLWPGPNSNTFVAHVGRSVPELGLDLPANAVGKDYLPLSEPLARSPGGGVQLSVLGLAGVLASVDEGIEVNLLGLSLGVDPWPPALRVPGLGRIGFPDAP